MSYYKNFKEIHDLLKEYNCKPTYSFYEEYREDDDLSFFFYETFSEEKSAFDVIKEQWKEKIVAELDVVLKTKIKEAVKGEIRFDIIYSDRVKKYSMYISLPTSGRSIPLSKNIYSTQGEVIKEIDRYIDYAKVRRNKPKKNVEQITFELEIL